MEGLLFYWLMWGIWITAAFLMDRGRLRSCLIFGTLLLIVLSGFHFSIGSFELNAAYLCLLFTSYIFFRGLSFTMLFYHVFASLIISLLYVLIHIYIMFDPVILLIIPKWMFIIGLFLVTQLLVRPFTLRMAVGVLGITHGELLNSLVFYTFDHTLGDHETLDHLAIFIFATLVCEGIHWIIVRFRDAFQRQYPGKVTK